MMNNTSHGQDKAIHSRRNFLNKLLKVTAGGALGLGVMSQLKDALLNEESGKELIEEWKDGENATGTIKISSKEIIPGAREELIQFANYLRTIKLQSLGIKRKSTLGAFLRVFRYYKILRENEINGGETPIPKNYLLALGMLEGYGDPASVNETDGGAGIIHMQSVSVREMRNKLGMPHFKTIYDYIEDNKHDEFAQKIKKYLWSDVTSHKKLGKLFQDLLDKWDRMVTVDTQNVDIVMGRLELQKLDSRFNPTECIKFAARYLQYVHKKILRSYKSHTKNASWDTHKNDKDFPFTRTLAINAYNKGPSDTAYLRSFTGSKKTAGNHVLNFKRNLRAARKYIDYIYPQLQAGKPFKEVLNNLIEKHPSLQ